MSAKSITLHEQLAITKAKSNQASKCRTELTATFASKRHLFEEKQVVFRPIAETAQVQTTVERSIQSTVLSELNWVAPYLINAIDAELQVSEANTAARADIVLEGETTALAVNVPATALLELDKRIAELKLLIEAIPTLDPAKGFVTDPTHAKANDGVFKARDVHKSRTQKVRETILLAAATEHHPAQVSLVDTDKVIGTLDEQEWSGLITPAAKADLIDRVEVVARAVKAARSRANNVVVNTTLQLGAKLVNFVISGAK